jgi:glycosyltransferase involved in cell wall biosynthesis
LSTLVLSHLFPSVARPGCGSFVADEVAELATRGHVSVVAPVRWVPAVPVAGWMSERSAPRFEVVAGVPVHRPRVLALPGGHVALEARYWPRQLSQLCESVVRTTEANLIHAHFGLPDGWAAMRLSARVGLPYVLTLHGSDVLVFPRIRRLARMLGEVLRHAAAVIAVSDEIAERAVALGARPETLVVQPCGVPSLFAPSANRNEVRRELGVPDDERVILWVGALIPVKRPLEAVAALEHVKAHDPRARLVMIGEGPLRAAVADRVAAAGLGGHVRLLGRLDRASVAAWQVAADIYCNTSSSEGTPVAAMEAAVSGTPIVAYAVGGLPSIVPSSIGRLVASGDTAELASALLEELAVPRARSTVEGHGVRFRQDRTATRVRQVHELIAHV